MFFVSLKEFGRCVRDQMMIDYDVHELFVDWLVLAGVGNVRVVEIVDEECEYRV